MDSKKFRLFIYYPIILALTLSAGLFLGNLMQSGQPLVVNMDSGSENGRRIGNLLDYINEEYVDTVDVDGLTESAIINLLDQLDPHSGYIPAKDLQAVNEPLDGNFDGIGVEFNIINDTIVVISAIVGGPSEKLGIRSGDRIVTIDGDTVAGVGFTSQDVIENLRGERGTKVDVGIFRRGEKNLLPYVIERGKVPIYSVDAGFMINEKTGYIKISRFAATTFDEYKEKFAELKDAGMENLVLDMRGNSGGYLQAAIEISDEFLKKKKLIVYTKKRDGKQNTHYATSSGKWEKGSIAVLIDEGSASASEIVAGAIQDNDRGMVIGRRSFGKGLVQEQAILPDGAAVRLTVARYYTPSGRCIQRDYTSKEDYELDILNRYESGELYHRDSIKVDSTQMFTTDGGKTVYGGGGIIPDLFVPLDTSANYGYLNRLLAQGILRELALEIANVQRESFKDVEDFKANFKLTVAHISGLNELAEKAGIAIPENQESLEAAYNELTAQIARSLFNGAGYYNLRLKDDKMIKMALENFN